MHSTCRKPRALTGMSGTDSTTRTPAAGIDIPYLLPARTSYILYCRRWRPIQSWSPRNSSKRSDIILSDTRALEDLHLRETLRPPHTSRQL